MATQTIASGWTIDGATITATGNSAAINLANANTWTGTQTFTNNSSLLVLGSANSWTLSANTGIKGTAITLTIPSSLSNNTFIINNSSSVPIFSVSGELNNLTSYHNTLDDGSGNATFTTSGAGIVSANGIKTTAGAATAVTVGASPYTYTNSSASNQQIFIQGGTVSAISFNPNGGTGISLSGLTDNVITMRPNDTLTITYTAAPTVNTIQL